MPGRDVLALLQPLVEDLAHKRVERHLALDLAFADHDEDALACEDPDIVDVERNGLGDPQRGEQHQHHQRPRAHGRTLGGTQQAPLAGLVQRTRRAQRRLVESDGFAWPQRDGLKWPHLALVGVVVHLA